jgi:hypothetical protein
MLKYYRINMFYLVDTILGKTYYYKPSTNYIPKKVGMLFTPEAPPTDSLLIIQWERDRSFVNKSSFDRFVEKLTIKGTSGILTLHGRPPSTPISKHNHLWTIPEEKAKGLGVILHLDLSYVSNVITKIESFLIIIS